MGVTVSNVAPSTMKPGLGPLGCLLVLIFSPFALASALSWSFLIFLKRNSSVHLEGMTCSTRTWILFLIIRFPTCTSHNTYSTQNPLFQKTHPQEIKPPLEPINRETIMRWRHKILIRESTIKLQTTKIKQTTYGG